MAPPYTVPGFSQYYGAGAGTNIDAGRVEGGAPPGYIKAPPWYPTTPENPYIPGGSQPRNPYPTYTPPANPYAQPSAGGSSMGLPSPGYVSGPGVNIRLPNGFTNTLNPSATWTAGQSFNSGMQAQQKPGPAPLSDEYLAHLRAIQAHMGGNVAPQYGVAAPDNTAAPSVAGLNQYGAQLGGGMARPYYASGYGGSGSTQGMNYSNGQLYGRLVA